MMIQYNDTAKFLTKMAIMKSCCCFKNVWNGSFASAIYTMIYFAFSSLILLIYAIDEREYLVGEHSQPKGETIIEKGDITKTHVIFNIIVLICSIGILASAILMIYGLKKNKREFLLPWILLMVGDVLAELFYAIHFLFSKRANFDPIVGFIFTMDLFIVCLNTYCLLCVISQYEEYKNEMNCRNRETNFTMSIQSSNDLIEKTTLTALPSQLLHKNTSQLHRSTHFLITSNQCSTISAIPEEEAITETHL